MKNAMLDSILTTDPAHGDPVYVCIHKVFADGHYTSEASDNAPHRTLVPAMLASHQQRAAALEALREAERNIVTLVVRTLPQQPQRPR